jgi:hypothetical protein
VTEAPAEALADSGTTRPQASTRDRVYGMLVVLGLVVLLFAASFGLLAALGFFGCGCTTVPATPA